MRLHQTTLPPASILEFEPYRDARGSFTRIFCERELASAGLPSRIAQTNLSRSSRRGTIRGMHFQTAPSREEKFVCCLRGKILDVVVDLRRDSATFLKHFTIELGASIQNALFVPRGFAHGFQTLTDEVEILYQMTDFYSPELSAGFRWDDPSFGIEWPLPDPTLSARDRGFPDFDVDARLAF